MSDSLRPHRLQQLSITNFQSLLKLMFIELVISSNHLILCRPLLLLPSIFPSIRVFSNESVLHFGGVSALASILPMNIQDWFPLGWTGLSPCCPRDCQESSPTPQFKTSILQHSTFFMVQLSHPHLTTQEKFPEYLPCVKHRSLFLGLQRGKRQIPAQTCGRINKCTMNHSARWGLGPRMSRRNTNSMGPRLG